MNVIGEDTTVNLFSIEFISSFARFDYSIPFVVIGITAVYVLKLLRRQRISHGEKGYPGSNVLLAFFYAMLGISIIQIVILISGITDIGLTINDFVLTMVFAVLFSLFSLFGAGIVVTADWFLFKKIYNDKVDSL
ncbi:MAG: hypothetical protein IIA83_09980 [Thaumarchaeota archaeon]|nr:hypothetical protein [Nitrososphaerota archaeon]